MNSIDLVRMGLKNLWRRKLRTFLTILGVIIGTDSIVVMVSLGFGMSENFKGEISKMGNLNTINVHPPYDMVWEGDKPIRNVNKNRVTLNDKAITDFQSISGVEAVSPMLENYIRFISGRYYADVPIKGIVPETMEAFDFEAKDGRILQEGDTFNLVFGANVPTMFQDEKFMTGRDIFYYDPEAEPKVNVLKDRLIMTFDMSYGIKIRGQSPNPDTKLYDKYKVKGVMSIYERTKEIGIMKVIGAALSDIRRIFLFEASIIGLIGGLLGIAISYLASLVLNKLAVQFGAMGPDAFNSKISVIPLWLALSSIIFTTIVGLISGFYPARRAMKLSALEAIRTE